MGDLLILGTTQIFSPPKPNISSATITLGPSITYTGSEQTQTVTSVVLGGTTLVAGTDYTVTDNTAISAGTYTLSVIAQGDYDGVATASWTIAKAAGSVSLDKTEISLDTSNVSDTITVTRAGNGTISATSSDTSIATVSVSGNVVTVTGVATGDATITINAAAGDNHLATSTTASVSVQFIGALDQCTPAQIQAVAQTGMGSGYWSVGDKTAAISISAFGNMSATSACAFILGFNHNSSNEGTNRIHFQFGKTTSGTDIAFQKLAMNSSNTNSGGWKNSNMRKTHCPAFLAALPSAWQAVIANCDKYSDNTGGGSNTASYVTKTTDKIFLLSEWEVFGVRRYANSKEKDYQQRYAYYTNGNSKVKYKHNDTGSASTWWLRSVLTSSGNPFCYVSTSGIVGYGNASNSYGFAPGFSIA